MELNSTEPTHAHATTSMKTVLLIFGIVVVAALGYLVWYQNSLPDSTNYSAPKVTTQTEQAEGEVASTPALECGDTKKYGFVMTFGDKWKGMKIKEVMPDYAIVTCYFNMPTASTDTVWTTESTTNFAKYASLFAVSVYTPAQWTTSQGEPNKPTELGHNTEYYWGWSQAQAIPDDLSDAYADVKNVVATFKIAS